jgi:hypothetical protein
MTAEKYIWKDRVCKQAKKGTGGKKKKKAMLPRRGREGEPHPNKFLVTSYIWSLERPDSHLCLGSTAAYIL